jgi:hypothetical protein
MPSLRNNQLHTTKVKILQAQNAESRKLFLAITLAEPRAMLLALSEVLLSYGLIKMLKT